MSSHHPITNLRDLLVGQSYGGVSIGDWFALSLTNDHSLVFHSAECSHGKQLDLALAGANLGLMDGVDAKDIPLAVALLRNRRQEITAVDLAHDGTLTLSFDGTWQLRILTTADNVDWQWTLNRTGADPYSDSIVACYFHGEVVMDSKLENPLG